MCLGITNGATANIWTTLLKSFGFSTLKSPLYHMPCGNLSVNLQNNCRDNPKQGAEFSGYYCVSGLCPRYGWSDWDHEYPAGTSDELPEFGFVINA
jgi:hypothetical protein